MTDAQSNSMKRFIQVLVVVSIAIGVFLRFYDLDAKTFWGDEADTALIISGYTFQEFKGIFDGRVTSMQALRVYQQPNASRGAVAIVRSLATEDAKHPPVFYILERSWAQFFGPSVASLRALAGVFGVLALLAMYWLGAELFASSTVRYVAVALLAISPFQIAYAHEAREYTFLSALALAASAALLRGLRRNQRADWVLYGAFVALGLYSAFLFALVVLVHSLYVIALHYRTLGTVRNFFFAVAAGVAPFLLWIPHVVALWHSDLAWGETAFPLKAMIFKWAFNLGSLFFDAELVNIRLATIAVVFVLCELYAVYYLCRTASASPRLLILGLTASTIAPFVALDIIGPSHFSTIAKYLVPSWLGIQLAVAYLFGSMLDKSKYVGLWAAGLAATLALGLVSSFVGIRSHTWWDNHDATAIPSIVRAINGAASPLVLAQPDFTILMLTHYVKPDTHVELYASDGTPVVHRQFANQLFLDPPKRLAEQLGKKLGKLDVDPDSTVIHGFHSWVVNQQATSNQALSRFGGADSLWRLADK